MPGLFCLKTRVCIFAVMTDEFISKATPEDIPELLPLINSAYRGEEAKEGWTHEADLIDGNIRTDEQTLLQLLQDPHSTILKYTMGKIIYGCVYLQKRETHLYLGMLSVSPKFQAKGIGKKLLEASAEHAREMNCQAIDMVVISTRKELVSWYERNGYVDTNKRQPFHTDQKFGTPRKPIDFMIMELNLVKPATNHSNNMAHTMETKLPASDRQ